MEEHTNEFRITISSDGFSSRIHRAIAILRNPYGFTEDEIKKAQLAVCDALEGYRDAYINMRDFAEEKGLNTQISNITTAST